MGKQLSTNAQKRALCPPTRRWHSSCTTTYSKHSSGYKAKRVLMQMRPVVGWLVCIGGKSYGQCYNLYGEKNFIGRSKDMDVALTEDNTVARNRHAILIYDPRAKVFYAQPGDSHELFYVNDKVVLQSLVLNDRDVLKIGKTTLVFVPFCDDRYSWDEE